MAARVAACPRHTLVCHVTWVTWVTWACVLAAVRNLPRLTNELPVSVSVGALRTCQQAAEGCTQLYAASRCF